MTTPTVTQPTPYSLQASCELSEDYFLTSDLIIGTGDEVIPFVNPYTNPPMVEAIVFSSAGSGSVYHLQRDPSATAGWTPVVINLSGNVTNPTDVAVAGNGSAVYMLVFGDPDNLSGAPAWLTQLNSATGWDDGYNASLDDLGFQVLDIDPSSTSMGPFKGGIDPSGNCYFYAAANDSTSQITSLIGWIAGPGWSGGVALNYQLLQSLESGITVNDYIVLFDASGGGNPVGYSLVLTSDQYLNVYAEEAFADQTSPQFGTTPLDTEGDSNVTALLWAWTTDGASGVPGYAFQTANETFFVAGDGSAQQSVFDQPALAANSVAVWTGDLDVVNLLDANGALNTILQNPDQSWQAIPIVPGRTTPNVPGLASIFGVPTDPDQSTLFAIGLDESLSVLSLDDSGWTQTLVRQDSAQQMEIDSYRVQITVLDANGVPLAWSQAQISTDRPIGFWQPDGSSFVTPGASVTLTTDGKGEITFSVPAEELDCAVLTVQALDPNGNPTGDPFTVTTDYDVRGFLGGTGTLTDIGPISGDALQQAQNSSGSALFPGLAADDQTQARTDTMTALKQFIVAGQSTAPGPTDTSMLQLSMNGQVPNVVTTQGPSGYASEELELTLSLGHLFDTLGHALRHGAADLASLTVQWSKAVGGWVVQIGAEIAGAVQQFANLVITDMKDAFHAIAGFFQALGADIVAAVEWLKHNVIDLLKAAWANGQTIAAFIDTAPPAFAYQVQKLSFETTGFFTGLETQANGLINNVCQAVTGETLGSAPQPPPPTDTGSGSAQSGLLKDAKLFIKVVNDSPGKWLLDKLLHDVPSIVSLGMPTLPQANYNGLVNQLGDDWVAGITFADSILEFLKTTFLDLFGTTRASALATSLPLLFSDLETMVDNFLKFCDDIAQTVLLIAQQAISDMGAFLTTSFNIVSSRSLLGQLLDLLRINPSMSLSDIGGLAIAFPATLVSKILGKGDTIPALPALPASDDPPLAGAVGVDPAVQEWLGILGGTAQAIWGLADIMGDLQTMAGEDGKRGEQSGAVTMFDIWCPVAETGLLFPLPPYAELEWAVAPIVFTALLPSIFTAFGLTSWPNLNAKMTEWIDSEAAVDTMANYVQPFIQVLSGAANTAFAVSFQVKNDDTYWVDILGTVLGNLSFLLAVFGTMWLNETTEDVPVLVKMIVDAIGNVGAAICIYESTSLPPK
jgi:hypothetical protein